jgi:hypothetical protein
MAAIFTLIGFIIIFSFATDVVAAACQVVGKLIDRN